MIHSSRTFRVFLSSTFADLVSERNALHEHVFPVLRNLCMAHGTRFQVVDLRWGVSSEAGFNQQTTRICLQEIERCQATGLRPNFLILLGDRYGWRPLPDEIPVEIFSQVLALAADDATATAKLKHWYRLDSNAQPPVHYLRARYGAWRDVDRWQDIEQTVLKTLESAARKLLGSNGLDWGASLTELEIRAGRSVRVR
jgi:hypothetical protein